jgi:hypothetical protein
VPAPEIVGANLDAAEEDGGLVVEHHARRTRLLVAQKVLAHVAVGDDLGRVDERLVAAGVVGVVVSVEEVLHRL